MTSRQHKAVTGGGDIEGETSEGAYWCSLHSTRASIAMTSTAKGDLPEALMSQSVRLHQERPSRHSQSASTHAKVADTDIHRPSTAAATSSPANQSEKRERHRVARREPQASISAKQSIYDSLDDDGIEGWGDFDADQLLAEPVDNNSSSSQDNDNGNINGVRLEAYLEAMGKERPTSQRVKSRKAARYSAPSTTALSALSSQSDEEPKRSRTAQNQSTVDVARPTTEVLRQRKLEAIEFDFPPDHSATYVRKRVALVGGQRRAQTNQQQQQQQSDFADLCLPLITQLAPTSVALEDRDLEPMLGEHLSGDELVRDEVRNRFLMLWSAMSPSNSTTPSTSIEQQTKSTFECSMAVLKLCKTVGISLAFTGPTPMAFWRRCDHANEQYVVFDEFFKFASRSIIQPALHHFKLDRSVNDYVATIGSIVANLIDEPNAAMTERDDQSDCVKKVKELGDVHALLPFWKSGILNEESGRRRRVLGRPAHCEVAANTVTASSPSPDEAVEQRPQDHGEVQPASIPLTSGQLRVMKRVTPGQLIDEAKDAHTFTIQRAVQLRSSWKRKPALNNERAHPMGVVTGVSFAPLEYRRSDRDGKGVGEASAVNHTVDADAGGVKPDPLSTPSSHPPQISTISDLEYSHVDQRSVSPPKEEEPGQRELLCSACSLATALLWCASCFSVLCESCWQEIHHSTVDMAHLHDSLTSVGAPLCPTVLPLRTKNDDNALGPSVPMVYLPTKAMSPVRVPIRGGGGVASVHNRRVIAEDDPMLADLRMKVVAMGIESHAILPTVLPSAKKSGGPKLESSESVEESVSIADLTKSLMLGAGPRHGDRHRGQQGVGSTSASTLSSHSAPSLWLTASSSTFSPTGPPGITLKAHQLKHRLRPTLRSSAVVLDASQLLPNNGAR